MLNALPAAIAVLDRSGVITEVNDQWRRFALDNSAEPGSPARNTEIGVNYLDVCGQSVGDSADLAEDARQGILAVLDGRIPRFSLEYPCHSPDQRRWFTLSAVPLGQQDHAVLVSHTDVTALKQAEEDLLKLATEATLAEERERRAIAADLHDDLGQTLHVARIKLDSLAKALPPDAARERLVRDLRDLVADASRSVRSLTSQLNPSILNELGLVPALAWLADEIERVYGLVVTVEDDGAPKPLTFAQSVILFRAVRELLINVSKHARTDSAVVRLRTNDGVLRIAVRDEGIGMVDWRAAMAAHRGFGLASVRARIVSLNGGMDIEANLGDGTTVTLDMPLELSAPPSPEVPPC